MADAGFKASSEAATSSLDSSQRNTAYSTGAIYGGGISFGPAPAVSQFGLPTNLTTTQKILYGAGALLLLILILRR